MIRKQQFRNYFKLEKLVVAMTQVTQLCTVKKKMKKKSCAL